MESKPINPAELILNKDGSIYHLHLKPEHIAPTVILVGDQERVSRISKHFDHIELKRHNREFVTHTGTYKTTRITVLSTGIGTDNIDIVMNELDAIVNVDLETRINKKDRKSLNIIRIGTSGSLQENIDVDTFLLSEYGLGFDGLVYYYQHKFAKEEQELMDAIGTHLNWSDNLSKPYIISASKKLSKLLGQGMNKGITATASGFYGPQGRSIYLKNAFPELNERLTSFAWNNQKITNFEMETSALYGLGKMMGHHCVTCCAIIANRISNQYSEDYKKVIDKLIITVLDRLTLL